MRGIINTEKYRTLEKESFRINDLPEVEKFFYSHIKELYRKKPSHMEFSNYWRANGERVWGDKPRKEIVESPIFKICQDLDSRLAIAEGHLLP